MRRALIALLAGCVAALAGGAATSPAAKPMQTGFNQYPSTAFRGTQAATGFGLVRDSGSTLVKLYLDWGAVAPTQPTVETDPADAAYDWAGFDQLVLDAIAAGLKPLVQVDRAPAWASDDATGRVNPDPFALGRFATAAARRYDGDPFPRVKLWQVWNEPNYHRFLRPQRAGNKAVSPAAYRSMINEVALGVKSVAADNLVLAGGSGPYQQSLNTAPFVFMRSVLCLDVALKPIKGCGPVRFDIWAHHPYTSGRPTRQAVATGDASLGDMPRMGTFLRAGARHGKVLSTGPVRFWVDEFGWDSNPPDPKGVPATLHRRWTAEMLMRLWDAGVSAVLLHQLADNPWSPPCSVDPPHNPYQSGLYFWAPTAAEFEPKPSLAAFRFPFAVVKEARRVRFWGRTPASSAGRVTLQRRVGSVWKTVGSLQATGVGVFNGRSGQPWTNGWFRAKLGGELSPSFELKLKTANPTYQPFGSYCGG